MSRRGEVGESEGVPAGKGEEVAEKESAGGSVVERVVGGAAGDEGVEGWLETQCGDEALQCVAGQGGVGLADEAEGVDPEGVVGQGGEAGEDSTFGGDVMGDGNGGGEEGVEARPDVKRLGRGGDGGAVGAMFAGRVLGEGVILGDAEIGVETYLDAVALEGDGTELPRKGRKALHHAGGLEV